CYVPKEKPRVNIGAVIRSYRSDRGLSQGDIERRTGLLRCYLSRVENGHTVPSLETLAKIAEAMEISLADFFTGRDSLPGRNQEVQHYAFGRRQAPGAGDDPENGYNSASGDSQQDHRPQGRIL